MQVNDKNSNKNNNNNTNACNVNDIEQQRQTKKNMVRHEHTIHNKEKTEKIDRS